MTKFEYILLVYLSVISLFSIIFTVADKLKAKNGGWRVPESTLMLLSLLGGSVAMLFTMRLVHHKTKKPRFMIGIPLIIVLQCALVYVFYKYGLDNVF